MEDSIFVSLRPKDKNKVSRKEWSPNMKKYHWLKAVIATAGQGVKKRMVPWYEKNIIGWKQWLPKQEKNQSRKIVWIKVGDYSNVLYDM